MSAAPDHLIRNFLSYKKVVDEFGPFRSVSTEQAASLAPNLIWSVTDTDYGTNLVNGFHNGSAVFMHLVAANSCLDEPMQRNVYEQEILDCLDCEDEDDCTTCNGEGIVLIDYQQIYGDPSCGTFSNDTIWATRSALE